MKMGALGDWLAALATELHTIDPSMDQVTVAEQAEADVILYDLVDVGTAAGTRDFSLLHGLFVQ